MSFGLGILTGAMAVTFIAGVYYAISKCYNNQPAVQTIVPSPLQQRSKFMLIKVFSPDEILPAGTTSHASSMHEEKHH
jgi:hypothetical protein